jgi:uncharacterized repeat protein (TIGR03803 family)
VFKVNTDGTGFTVLHDFTGSSDGASPEGRLILSGNALYGTANEGGASGNGTVFKVNTDGTGFTNLYNFSGGGDGGYPHGLILSDNTLYGMAQFGGSSTNGTVFTLHTDGTGFTVLHNFTALSVPYTGNNGDGANPVDGLILSGNALYGTAGSGGSAGNGTVFTLNTDGTGFTVLHTFTPTSGSNSTNGDGASRAVLFLSGNTLYGTTIDGGSSGKGTIFSLIPSAHP